MNLKNIFSITLIHFIVMKLVSCAFVPKTVPIEVNNKSSCITNSSNLEIGVIPINMSGYYCHHAGCAAVILAIPIITAAVTIPIVIVSNTINLIEEQIRCN